MQDAYVAFLIGRYFMMRYKPHQGIPGVAGTVLFSLIFIALVAQPVMAQGFSVAYDQVEFEVSPGHSFTGLIGILNNSDEPVNLRIYLGDWVRVPDSTDGYVFDSVPGNEPRSFISWMNYGPESITIDPDERRDVRYQVTMPADETLEGSYWGVIFIENIPPDLVVEENSEDAVMQVGITTVFRYAIQIYATIRGTEVRDVTFTTLSFEQNEGGLDVTAVAENLGNIFTRPEVWLEIINTSGDVVYEQEHIRQTLLPESARDYIFQLRQLPVETGTYLVRVMADYGVPTLIACQGRIEITGEETDTGDPMEVPASE